MLALNAQKIRTVSLYASTLAALGLGSSILSCNEDGFILRVPVAQQRALLLFASALAMRALYILLCEVVLRRSRQRQIEGTPVFCEPGSLTGPASGKPPESSAE